jgi:hypothetical protein
MTTPSPALLAAARAHAEATWSYDPGSYQTAADRERHLDQDALSTTQEAWFAALWEAGVAEGRRQATEGWERQWAVEMVDGPPYQVDDEDHARWHVDRGYTTGVLYRLVSPWKAAEQNVPAEGGDHGDAFRCHFFPEQCPDRAPRWSLLRHGDAVADWACDQHLAGVMDMLQRPWERTEVVARLAEQDGDVRG